MVVQHSWLMIDAVQLRSLLPNYNILKRREFEIIDDDDVAFSQFSSSFLNSCLFVGVLLLRCCCAAALLGGSFVVQTTVQEVFKEAGVMLQSVSHILK